MMYLMYKLLMDGYTVVYEPVITETVFVIPSKGECRAFRGRATVDVVKELYNQKTVHLFDASAGINAREPIKSPAKVIIGTSPHYGSFKQFLRIGAAMLHVPSYTKTELIKRSAFFSEEITKDFEQKIEKCGTGSIRLVLGMDMLRACALLHDAVKNTTVSNVLDIVQGKDVDVVGGIKGPSALFTASLIDGADTGDINSYLLPEKTCLNISSKYIMDMLVSTCKDEAFRFAARASAIFQQTPQLESTGAFFFEVIASKFVACGGKCLVRQLSSSSGNSKENEEEWPQLKEVDARSITELSDAFKQCSDPNTLFTFTKKMAGIDSFNPPKRYFQYTGKESHTINLEVIVSICKEQKDPNAKVPFYFIVPQHRFQSGWTGTQSFSKSKSQINMSKLLALSESDLNNFWKVKKNEVEMLNKNLVQFAVCLDVSEKAKQSGHQIGGSANLRVKKKSGVREFSTVPKSILHSSKVNFRVLTTALKLLK